MRKIIMPVFFVLTFLCSSAMSETAVEWFDKANALFNKDLGQYADPSKAIEYLNNALQLQPDYAKAYEGRGIVILWPWPVSKCHRRLQ